MKISLKLLKNEKVVYEGRHEVNDAREFGDAFAEVWNVLHTVRMEQATSVGELMSMISEDVLDDVHGSTITISRL